MFLHAFFKFAHLCLLLFTFSSLAIVKRMKANWTMLAMIWVCKYKMVWFFSSQEWWCEQPCSALLTLTVVVLPDMRSTRCELQWRSCKEDSGPQQQFLIGGHQTRLRICASIISTSSIARQEQLTKVGEHEQQSDQENHPARDHLRRHKESQPWEANLELAFVILKTKRRESPEVGTGWRALWWRESTS